MILLKYSKRFGFCTHRLISRYRGIMPPMRNMNYTNYVFELFDKHPGDIYLINENNGDKFSFGDVKQMTKNVASKLTEIGVNRETKMTVGIVSKNCCEVVPLMLAVIGTGSIAVPVNPGLTEYEFDKLLEITKPQILFGDAEVLKKLKNNSKFNYIKKFISTTPIDESESSILQLSEFIQSNDRNCPIGPEMDQFYDDTCLNVYSSGTSGLPKAIKMDHSNIIACSTYLGMTNNVEPCTTIAGIMPFYHIYGFVLSHILTPYSSSNMVVSSKFEPIKFLDSIQKYKINHLHIVPPIAVFLASFPQLSQYDLSSVSRITVGGAPLDKRIEKAVAERFLIQNPRFFISQGYGLSETMGVLTVVTRENKKFGSVGKVIPSIYLKIVKQEDHTKEVEPNEIGEILASGPLIMKGYVGMNRDDPRNDFQGDWLVTGDVGYLDNDENLFISDRKKELIKVKGLQVTPSEIEALLLNHPCIEDCGVIGVFDEKFGEVPRAFVKKRSDITENDVCKYVAEHLSDHKKLRGGVKFVESIPKTVSGKILRRILREDVSK